MVLSLCDVTCEGRMVVALMEFFAAAGMSQFFTSTSLKFFSYLNYAVKKPLDVSGGF